MTTLIEKFREWYHGPEGKAKWIRDAEPVDGLVSRAYLAGYARRDAELASLAVSPEGLRELENEKFHIGPAKSAQFAPGRLPEPPPVDWERMPRDGGSGQQFSSSRVRITRPPVTGPTRRAEKTRHFQEMYGGPPPVTRADDYTRTNDRREDPPGPFEGAQDRAMEVPGREYGPDETFTWPRYQAPAPPESFRFTFEPPAGPLPAPFGPPEVPESKEDTDGKT